MTVGILEPSTHHEHVAGTALLEETEHHSDFLKRGKGKDAGVVLIPQPSADPNDPLNWPLWQRDLILLLYAYCTLLCVGSIGPLFSVIALPLMAQFHLTFTQISLLTGYNLATVGASGILISILARKFGKRPIFLQSLTVILIGTIVGATSTTHGALIASRVIQGLGLALFESVTFSIIGDMYHVHQRGSRMAIYLVSQSGIANMPSLIAGVVAERSTWQWVFWIIAIFLGIGLVLAIFFGWETSFDRSSMYNIDTSSKDCIEVIDEIKGNTAHVESTQEDSGPGTSIPLDEIPARKSLIARIAPYSGIYTSDPVYKMFLKPFVFLFNPAILWAVLFIAFSQLWTIVISFCIAQLFSPPPYLLNTAQIGYVTGGPIVGGLLGCLACGWISDPTIKFMSKRNNGIYEPEFRLILSSLILVTGVPGTFLFGVMAAELKSPVIMSVLWGMVFAGCQFTANSLSGYLIDAYRDASVDIFIMSMTIKNFLFFGFSFFLNDWIALWGPRRAFLVIGGITVAWAFTAIPIYVFGKRIRAWWQGSGLPRLV